MDENDKIEKLGNSKKFEAEGESVELRGKDGGAVGVMTQFEFLPNAEFYKVPEEDQMMIVRRELDKVLYAHCDKIGWYPDRSPEISKNEKGAFRITAYLKRGTGIGAKLASELDTAGMVGINDK